jgi:small GTP-binding protein
MSSRRLPSPRSSVSDHGLKVSLVGASDVGKTSLLNRFVTDTFHPHHHPTLGVDFKAKTCALPAGPNGEEANTAKLVIHDTAGQARFQNIVPALCRKSRGIVVVYDVMHRPSFEHARACLANSNITTANEPVALVLAGNKIDLATSGGEGGVSAVAAAEGRRLAQNFGATFFEVSAKNNTNVAPMFSDLAANIVNMLQSEGRHPPGAGASPPEPVAKPRRRLFCCSARPQQSY